MQLKQYRSCEGLGTKHAVREIRRCFPAVARNDRHYALVASAVNRCPPVRGNSSSNIF